MNNRASPLLDGNVAPGFWALLASFGMQSLTPFQYIFALYPEYLRTMMVPLSALILGITVSTVPILLQEATAQRVRRLLAGCWVLMVVAILALVVLTLRFVVEVHSADEGTTQHVVIGVQGRLCAEEICAPSLSPASCLEIVGADRSGSMRCWGDWQVVVAETIIFAAYVSIALFLGGLGGLMRVVARS